MLIFPVVILRVIVEMPGNTLNFRRRTYVSGHSATLSATYFLMFNKRVGSKYGKMLTRGESGYRVYRCSLY